MVLGDGCIRRKPNEQNYQFIMTHSLKQKEYALWKKTVLEQVGTVKTYIYEYLNTKYPQVTISTNTRKYFSKLAEKFYTEDRTKIVTKNILNKITPLGLAIWYMDDGTLCFHKDGSFANCELYTCSFSKEENELIISWLKRKYNLQATLRLRKDKFYSIAFNKSEAIKFIELVKEYIHKSMQYKSCFLGSIT